MSQKSVAFGSLGGAESDARFISARDGTAILIECNCYGARRWYVGTNAMPRSRRHDERKHRQISRWVKGQEER
jgi:hypothetical protein